MTCALRDPWLVHERLEMIVKSGALQDRAVVVDLKDHERALVWIDGRFNRILGPGLYALWTTVRDVRVEVLDARVARFEHDRLAVIARSSTARSLLCKKRNIHHILSGWLVCGAGRKREGCGSYASLLLARGRE